MRHHRTPRHVKEITNYPISILDHFEVLPHWACWDVYILCDLEVEESLLNRKGAFKYFSFFIYNPSLMSRAHSKKLQKLDHAFSKSPRSLFSALEHKKVADSKN